MAAALLFHDLSLLSDDSSSSSRLVLSARALELGYAAVALDHPHRGILGNSHRCSTQPFAPLSSLPLPTSAALHRRRLASPTSEPFRQCTRITLSIDYPAAAASALAPSAARLLRTYDIVAARPLNQAAFDHLCQVPYSQQLDLISIDFSHKLPFRLKLPMLKLALQRGLHFEIAYSPFIATDGDKCILADAKLLADWTKGKNLIISSAARTATQIRGPYDVINLLSYLLGLPMNRAKAAISTNPRSLILRALRKKHFYKETIRIDRLLPHEQLDSTKVMLSDWVGWDSESKTNLHSETNQLEPSPNKDQRPNSPIHGIIQMSHHNPDVSVISKTSEPPTHDDEILSHTQDETVQADILMDHGPSLLLSSSFDHQYAAPYKPGHNEDVLDDFVKACSSPSVDLQSADKRVEFDQDAMEVDATESCRLNLVADNNIPRCMEISDTSVKLACSALPQGMEISGTCLEEKGPGHSGEILDDARSYAHHHTYYVSDEMGKTPLAAHEISSGFDVCFRETVDIRVDTEAYSGSSKPIECPLGGKDNEELIDQSIVEDIEQTAEGQVETTDLKTRKDTSVGPLFQGQEINSIHCDCTYLKGSIDAYCESDELKEQISEETIASLRKNIAETHEQSLHCPYPNSKVEIPTFQSEKRRRKLRLHHSAYLPFLGFLKSAHFKRKVCRIRDLVKPM